MQDKKPRHTQITSEHTRGRKVKYYRGSESVAGGDVTPDTRKIQQALNLQRSSITTRNSERPLSSAHTQEKTRTARRSDHCAIHSLYPGAQRGRDPETPAAHPQHEAPVPSVPRPASGAAASGGSAATALSSRHRAAARESGGARGALLPTGGLMPAWGAAFQQESLWGEGRSRG